MLKSKTYTIIWRIQAEGTTPQEAVEEAYEIFKDPGEALMFEAYEGVKDSDPAATLVDMNVVESGMQEEENSSDPCQSCARLGTVLCVGDTGGYSCKVPY